jgi:hypothetical protein
VQWNAASKPGLLVDEEVENAIADDHVSGSGRDAGQRRRLVDGGADRSARRCPAEPAVAELLDCSGGAVEHRLR